MIDFPFFEQVTKTALISQIRAVKEEKRKTIKIQDMTKKKLAYEAPITDVLELRVAETLLKVSGDSDIIKANEIDYGEL